MNLSERFQERLDRPQLHRPALSVRREVDDRVIEVVIAVRVALNLQEEGSPDAV